LFVALARTHCALAVAPFVSILFSITMRTVGSFALVAASAVTSGLLLMLSHASANPPIRPIVGLYEYQLNDTKNSQLDLMVDFFDWNAPDLQSKVQAFLKQSRQQRRLPLLNLEPFADQASGRGNADLLSDVLTGHYDKRLQTLANTLRAESLPVLLRFGHEMDKTGQYAWGFSDPKHYITLYQYVYSKLNGKAMPHVRWVWSPAGTPEADRFWPGHAYVDLIGISIYASRAWTTDHSLESFSEILQRNLWLSQRYGRPLLVAEAGVSGSAVDQQRWIKDAVVAMAKFPEVCGLVYFQAPQPNWMPLPTGHENWQLKQGPLGWLLKQLPLAKRRGLACVEA
jgi:endoglucanase